MECLGTDQMITLTQPRSLCASPWAPNPPAHSSLHTPWGHHLGEVGSGLCLGWETAWEPHGYCLGLQNGRKVGSKCKKINNRRNTWNRYMGFTFFICEFSFIILASACWILSVLDPCGWPAHVHVVMQRWRKQGWQGVSTNLPLCLWVDRVAFLHGWFSTGIISLCSL